MKKFILILVIVYVVYYGIIILWDGFLKKTPKQENNEGDEMVFDDEEEPQKVTLDEIATVPEDESDGVGGRQLQISVEEANIINGEIEDQGIESNKFIDGFKQAADESRGMFANVNF